LTYTPNGEVQTISDVAAGTTTTYGYDAFGQLRSVHMPDGRIVEYVTDGLHRRIGKKVNGSLVKRWLYRNYRAPVAELDANGAVLTRFVYVTSALTPAFIVKNGTTYRVITDDVGTPTRIVDASTGIVAQAREVDEFGVTISDTAPDFQPIGFGGGLADPDTGLVHLGAREYHPTIGRWLSKDPFHFIGSVNSYVYAFNDPINYFDPTGWTGRDRWYGFNERDFQNWVHRQMKDDGQADFTKDELEQLHDDWIAQGRPGGDKSNKPRRGRRGRQSDMCVDSQDSTPTDPESELDSSAEPDPDPESGPNNSPFTPFEGPGPWWEDGRPVNPVPKDWLPLPFPGAPPSLPPIRIPELGPLPSPIPLRLPL